jgi:hypothetical protein
MNPLVQKWLGSLVRAAVLAMGASGLDWSDGEVDQIVNAVMVLGAVAWSLVQKYREQRTQNTTIAVLNRLTGPDVDNVTANDIADVIKKGDAAPAMTPKDEAPKLTGTGDGMRLIRNVTGTGNGQ